MPQPLHVVLHRPEIPNNTGNIGRTCVATGAALHLIHPLGFDTDDKACRRAGLDYWPRLNLREHQSWEDYLKDGQPARVWTFSTRADLPIFDADFRPGDHLVFGCETVGLPDSILDAFPGRRLVLPMLPGERSLNLGNVVCTVLYEAIRQMLTRGEASLEPDGRLAPPDGVVQTSPTPASGTSPPGRLAP